MKFGNHDASEVRDLARGGGGTQWKFAFPNGYGASVINDGYGRESGLYELAVLHDGAITYETPVTDDVLGWLTPGEVSDALDQIEALTPEAVRESASTKAAQARASRIAELREELAALEAEVSA